MLKRHARRLKIAVISVKCGSVQTLEVEDAENKSKQRDVFVQADGEHLGFLPAKFSILPQQLDFIL